MATCKRLSEASWLRHRDNLVIGSCVDDAILQLKASIANLDVIVNDPRLKTRLPDHELVNMGDVMDQLKQNLSYLRKRKNKRIDAQVKRSRRLTGEEG